MKIAVLIDRIYPYYLGGYETLMHNMITRLGTGYQIDVYTSMDEELVTSGSVRYIKIAEKHRYTNAHGQHSLLGSVTFLLSTVRNIRKLDGYDYVILETIPYFGLGFILSRIKSIKISYFQEAWYLYPPDYRRLFVRKAIRSILKHTDLAVAISESTAQSIKVNYGFEKVITIPVGVDVEKIQESAVPDETFDVSYMGRLGSIKNVKDIIKAVALMTSKGIKLKTLIIGDGEERRDLLDLANTLGVLENVTFTGKVTEETKYKFLKSSRIFVLASEREGFSIATLEAMACGNVPVVARPPLDEVFGVSHLVKNDYNGLYFTLNNISDLAEKIEKLLKDSILYERLRENSLHESEKYDWSDIVRNFRALLAGTFKEKSYEPSELVNNALRE